ncbi:hypothetical protein D3C87_1016880 [compost metagenome]
MLDSGNVQRQIVDHITEINELLAKANNWDATIALLQAKSMALVALSNTKAHRIISK